MGRVFGFLTLIIVVAVGAYIYMRRTQSVMTDGTSTPTATVDVIGVKNDLLAIAQAERSHGAQQGSFVSIDELRSKGDLTMLRDHRGPYTYSADVSSGSFRISSRPLESPIAGMSARLDGKVAVFPRANQGARAGDERLTSNRIRPRTVPDQREPRTSL